MPFHWPQFMLINLILLAIFIFVVDVAKPRRGQQQQQGSSKASSILQEYREVLPKDVFNQFTAIYLDQSLKTIEKLKLLDELFMTLPDNMLKKLPIPSAFRRLPLEERRRIHRIFYAKTIPFRDKLRRLEQFMRELPGQKRELVPIRPIQTKRLGSAERRGEQPMPTLVEFDVPVLLQFNGHMETNALRQYLAKEDFQLLKWLINRHSMDELTRARLIGILLKKSYQIQPDNFPLPLNGDSQEIADEIRHLGVRLMFGRNPFDRVDPFAQKFEMLKRIRANTGDGNKCRTNGFEAMEGGGGEGRDGELCQDGQEQMADGTAGQGQNAKSSILNLENIDLFPGAATAGIRLEDLRQQDQQGTGTENNTEKEEEAMAKKEEQENGRMSGDVLGKFIALFNGSIHWDN